MNGQKKKKKDKKVSTDPVRTTEEEMKEAGL